MTREEKLETIVKLFAKCMFYGKWKWETPNERVIEMLMKDVGYYNFVNEDEMISKTTVDDDLYEKANIVLISEIIDGEIIKTLKGEPNDLL